jgi:excisionase family DNA binding protein
MPRPPHQVLEARLLPSDLPTRHLCPITPESLGELGLGQSRLQPSGLDDLSSSHTPSLCPCRTRRVCLISYGACMGEFGDQLSFDFAEARHEARDGAACRRRKPARRQSATRRDKADESAGCVSERRTPPSLVASDSLLTTAEAARLLRVHPRTVQRLVQSGALSAIHIGRAVRFDSRDLVALTDRLRGNVSATRARRSPGEVAPVAARQRAPRRSRVRG